MKKLIMVALTCLFAFCVVAPMTGCGGSETPKAEKKDEKKDEKK